MWERGKGRGLVPLSFWMMVVLNKGEGKPTFLLHLSVRQLYTGSVCTCLYLSTVYYCITLFVLSHMLPYSWFLSATSLSSFGSLLPTLSSLLYYLPLLVTLS